MMNTNLEQFLSRFLVANYIFITWNYNTSNCNFPNATNRLLYYPSLRSISIYHVKSAWHVTSSDQGLSSTRGKSLGTRLRSQLYGVPSRFTASSVISPWNIALRIFIEKADARRPLDFSRDIWSCISEFKADTTTTIDERSWVDIPTDFHREGKSTCFIWSLVNINNGVRWEIRDFP
jgi:hypothetical protein